MDVNRTIGDVDIGIADRIIELLALKPLKNGRFYTDWGDKTASGLGACVKRIVEEEQAKFQDPLIALKEYIDRHEAEYELNNSFLLLKSLSGLPEYEQENMNKHATRTCYDVYIMNKESEEIIESLEEKMGKAFYLSMDVSYKNLTPADHYFIVKDIDLPDFVWAWADGRVHKYYEDTTTGRCSLSRSINFDIEKFEARVDDEIKQMEELLKKHGPPKKLTVEEMRAMGYRY